MHNLNCFISGQVSTSIPNLAASLEPVSLICFKEFIIEGVEDLAELVRRVLIRIKDFTGFLCRQTINLVKIMVLVLLDELLFDLIEDFLALAFFERLESLHSFIDKVD